MNKLTSEEGGGFHEEVLQKYTGGFLDINVQRQRRATRQSGIQNQVISPLSLVSCVSALLTSLVLLCLFVPRYCRQLASSVDLPEFFHVMHCSCSRALLRPPIPFCRDFV